MDRLFSALAAENHLGGLDPAAFAERAAHYLSEMNVIHPFREGNGRTQKAFLLLLAERAGHPVDVRGLQRAAYVQAMIDAFHGNERPLAELLRSLI